MRTSFILLSLGVIGLTSCQVYQQHLMFQDDGSVDVATLTMEQQAAVSTYQLRPFDTFTLEIFTGDGERIIDPEFALMQEVGPANQLQGRPNPEYVIQGDSIVRLPMIGFTHLAGLTQQQAEVVLQQEYSNYYEDVYCLISIKSRRMFVLGAVGSEVVLLPFEGMTVLEVLASVGPIESGTRVHNLKLIRGEGENLQVQTIDLSTLAGLQQAELRVQPGDVLYVEPQPRIVRSSFQDISPFINLISSSLSVVAIIISLNR